MPSSSFEKLNAITDTLNMQSDALDAHDPRFGELIEEIDALKTGNHEYEDAKFQATFDGIRAKAKALIEGVGGNWNDKMIDNDDRRFGGSAKRGGVRLVS